MNNEKIARAADVSDKVADDFTQAQGAPKNCWVNGYGVLTDPSIVRSQLRAARDTIHEALQALDGCRDWPRDNDYD